MVAITECSQESLPDETHNDYHLQAVAVTGCNRELLPDEYINNQSNNQNNSLSNDSKNEFFQWRDKLFPEERESFEKFVENKIAELPRKVVLKDEWLIHSLLLENPGGSH